MKGYRIVLVGIGAAFAVLGGLAPQAVATDITCSIGQCPPSCHPVFTGGGCTVGSFSMRGTNTMTTFVVTVNQVYTVMEPVNGVSTEVGTVTFNSKGVATYKALK